jgi:peptidoglycan/LPS O-acetylase OafA/YrhL
VRWRALPLTWLASRPLAGVGIVSYGLYLWHVPVLLWLRARGLLPMHPAGALAVGGSVSLAVAAVSWRTLESPAIDWARGRSRRRRARSEVAFQHGT